MPHRILRRLVIAPLVVAAEVAVILISPLLLVLALVTSPILGGLRPLRMLAIVLVGVARHLAATLACLGLWIASGFGWRMRSEPMQRAHYAVMRWFAAGIYETIVLAARVTVRLHDSDAAAAALAAPGRPVIVLSRHAGEGDTLLVIHQLLTMYGRGPRIVMHEALRFDPLIDALGDRLPNRFLDPRGGDTEAEIAAMATGLGGTAALVIFPEGGNFTTERRARGIERLERHGHVREAELARSMKHMTAPRPGGSLAAIEGAPPTADIVVMAHTGFPSGLRDVWRLLPEEQTVDVRMWHVPRAEVPTGRTEQIAWLFDWWQTMDGWIDARENAGPARPEAPRGD